MKRIALIKLAAICAALSMSVPILADPPDTSGPNVTRFEDTLIVINIDTDAGLTAMLGFNPYEACAFIFDFDTVEIKEVDVPSADERIVSQFRGYVRASVWPFVIPDDVFFPAWCELVDMYPPLATGMADINGTDNDLLVFTYVNKNENAFGWNAHGTLYDEGGQARIFHLTYRAHWGGDGTDPNPPFFAKTKIKLK